jgi:hypothetical protein
MQTAEQQALATSANSTTSTVRQPRQVIRFTGLSDVISTAQALYQAQCLPRGVDNWEKLVPMLLAGAELGLGIMQTLKSITPPVNGHCNLYGDMGLALVRASGLLAKLDERIEGDGDDRKAVCVIQRAGYSPKTFEYPLRLAKALKSYQVAHKINDKTKQPIGGPWHDDPDNMLMWRARWRALRTEFTDVLAGMGGAEEQDEEQAITVEVTHSTQTVPALTSGGVGGGNSAVPCVTQEQLAELSRLKKALEAFLDPATAASRWKQYLADLNLTSARDLTIEQAAVMIGHFTGFVTPPFDSATPPTGPAASAS